MNVKIKLIENGVLPKFAHAEDACCDCYARLDKTLVIYPNQRALIPLGFALQLPSGYEAMIRPRSGLSSKGIDVCLGTVDANFRGEIKANVVNNSDIPFSFDNGDRICQMAIRKTETINWEEVKELAESERGSNGFGSSGIR